MAIRLTAGRLALALAAVSMIAPGLVPAESLAAASASHATSHPIADLDNTETAETPAQREFRARDKAQSTAALRGYSKRTQPFIADPIDVPVSSPVLVLTRRDQPYTMSDVVAQFPASAAVLPDASVLLMMPLLVGPGATLIVDSASTPRLLLMSSQAGYATLTVVEGRLQLTGAVERPLTISSASDSTGVSPDNDIADGRAYIAAQGARMDIAHTDLSDLGFLLGETSGVSWMARRDMAASGSATDSSFRRNYFGAYSSGADGLTISRVEFTDNLVYGFDPHTGTVNTVVESSLAARNGRHGFIFSKDCHNNVIRDSVARDNGGAGFVIDDGNDDGADPLAASNENLLQRVTATNNGTTGVVVEGGSRNTVDQALISANPVGLWVKNAATDTAIVRSTVTAAEQAGIRLNADTVGSDVRGSTIGDSRVGIAIDGARGTILSDVTITDADDAAITTTTGLDELSATNVTINGTGESAVRAPGQSSVADGLVGIDTSNWSSGKSGASTAPNRDFWVKLAPWLLILAVPLALWIPFRWRWRRRQAAVFGPRP